MPAEVGPALSPPAFPGHETVISALLVCGRDALETKPGDAPDDGSDDERQPQRVFLRRSGVRRPDGSVVALGVSHFRHRRFCPMADDPLPAAPQHLPGLAIFGGVMGNAFGHQVTQSVGRLWAGALAPEAPILFLPETATFTEIPGYVRDLARSLGVQNDLRLVTRATRCDSLVVPEDSCNLDLRPCATPFFRRWLADRRPLPPPGAGLDLYVSRSRLALDNGQFLQEEPLQQALADCGYRVIHPEGLSIPAQLELYSAARRLIFADGSAAHLWTFAAQPQQKVAIVLRRPRDRKFARWFRSFDSAPPAWLDRGIADFYRRGEGTSRSVALLDLPALWQDLRSLGFHDAPAPPGPDRAALEAWLSHLEPPRLDLQAAPVPALDPRSVALLALRSRFGPRSPGPGAAVP